MRPSSRETIESQGGERKGVAAAALTVSIGSGFSPSSHKRLPHAALAYDIAPMDCDIEAFACRE